MIAAIVVLILVIAALGMFLWLTFDELAIKKRSLRNEERLCESLTSAMKAKDVEISVLERAVRLSDERYAWLVEQIHESPDQIREVVEGLRTEIQKEDEDDTSGDS